MEKQIRVLDELQDNLVNRSGYRVGGSSASQDEFRSQKMTSFPEFETEPACFSVPQLTPEDCFEHISGELPTEKKYNPYLEASGPENSWAQEFQISHPPQEQWRSTPLQPFRPSRLANCQAIPRTIGWTSVTINEPNQYDTGSTCQKTYNTSCTNIEDAVQEIYDVHICTSAPSWSWKHSKKTYINTCANSAADPALRLEMLMRHFSL